MSEEDKACYNDTYAPQNIKHGCMMQQYEEQNTNSIISPITWRKFITYVAVPIGMPIALNLSKFIQTHNMMASNNLGLFQHLGILAIPILAPINKWPLVINDFIYSISGMDWLLNDIKVLNYLFGVSTTTTTTKHKYTIHNSHQPESSKSDLDTQQHQSMQKSEKNSQDTNQSDEPSIETLDALLNIEDLESYLLALGDETEQSENL